MDEDVWQTLLKEVNVDGTGDINFDAFSAMMK